MTRTSEFDTIVNRRPTAPALGIWVAHQRRPRPAARAKGIAGSPAKLRLADPRASVHGRLHLPLTGPPLPSTLHEPEEPGRTLQTENSSRTVHDAFPPSPPLTEQKSPFAPFDETEQNAPFAALHSLPLPEGALGTEQ